MGQVSLPVLSRKGKADYWINSWYSTNNYNLQHSEVIFLNIFFSSFYKNYFIQVNQFKKNFYKNHNHYNSNLSKHLFNNINVHERRVNPYISKMFLCKYNSWLLVYHYNLQIQKLLPNKKVSKKKHITKCKNFVTVQLYHFAKSKFL